MITCCGQEIYTDPQSQKYDRRHQLITQIKEFIGSFDHQDLGGQKAYSSKDRRSEPCCTPTGSDLAKECREFRKRQECEPPIITAIGIHETRPTSNFTRMQHENTDRLTFVDATGSWKPMPPAPWELPRKPSQELRASTLYQNCECVKRNGLQHDCPRWDCAGRPECVAINPGPCCWTSKARKPVRGDRRAPPRSYKPSSEHQRSSPFPGNNHNEIPGLATPNGPSTSQGVMCLPCCCPTPTQGTPRGTSTQEAGVTTPTWKNDHNSGLNHCDPGFATPNGPSGPSTQGVMCLPCCCPAPTQGTSRGNPPQGAGVTNLTWKNHHNTGLNHCDPGFASHNRTLAGPSTSPGMKCLPCPSPSQGTFRAAGAGVTNFAQEGSDDNSGFIVVVPIEVNPC